jgi:hypothetical protein
LDPLTNLKGQHDEIDTNATLSPVAIWRTRATSTATNETTPDGAAAMSARIARWRPTAIGHAAAIGHDQSPGDSLLVALNALPSGHPARTANRANAINWYLPLAGHLVRRYADRGAAERSHSGRHDRADQGDRPV